MGSARHLSTWQASGPTPASEAGRSRPGATLCGAHRPMGMSCKPGDSAPEELLRPDSADWRSSAVLAPPAWEGAGRHSCPALAGRWG